MTNLLHCSSIIAAAKVVVLLVVDGGVGGGVVTIALVWVDAAAVICALCFLPCCFSAC